MKNCCGMDCERSKETTVKYIFHVEVNQEDAPCMCKRIQAFPIVKELGTPIMKLRMAELQNITVDDLPKFIT